MSESLNRRACDRCHSQKLSCKRVGDGVCDRCLRLNAECKSSPSLRYKKHIQQNDQAQEQMQQSQPQQQQQQKQSESSQPSLQRYQSREQLQPQQQNTPRPGYLQGQGAICQNVLDPEIHQHIGSRDSTERRSPKRRRTGSEVDHVPHEAATDATINPGLQSHLMTAPDGSIGLAEYTMNLRDMSYMALSQPPVQPNHLLGPQIPLGPDNYFNLHQVIPSLWTHQSHEDAQQQQQLPHHHLLHHHQDHREQQQVFGQVSVVPLVVPDPAAVQQDSFSSSQQPQRPYLHQQRAAAILGSRRRPVAPVLSHTIFSPYSATERRSRSNKVRINYTEFVVPQIISLSKSHMMDQFFEIYARIRVLSQHLESLEQGQDYINGPGGKPNEFTVAELYKHTHQFVDVLERVVAIRSSAPRGDSSSAAAARFADCPIDAGDLANGMFTVALYAQLLDVMQRLFTHVRAVLARADPKSDDTFAAWLLPEMNIGAASIGAHPAFHMSLTVQLAMQFLSRLRDATVFLGLAGAAAINGSGPASAPHGADGANVAVEMTTLSFDNLKIKEGDLSKTLGVLQDELNDFMDAMDAIDALAEDEKK
ncbi:Fungal transcriptional regulatory [Cordyceps militaris]|uniref:Fungal transcriptional regulatory n=1 Tax=Cordyceps militaris TaxID=73501 RepID=A0A2H4SQT7_CORMI|nr:Fungal transcriptional regulatory [Cordyceps militaris]